MAAGRHSRILRSKSEPLFDSWTPAYPASSSRTSRSRATASSQWTSQTTIIEAHYEIEAS